MLSSKFNVYNVEWLDVVFANRNQTYGAYELRKNYSSRLIKALFVASTLFVTVVCSPLIYDYLKKEDEIVEVADASKPKDDLVKIVDVVLPPKKVEKIFESKGAQKQESNFKQKRFVKPVVTASDKVTEELPEQSALADAVVASTNQEGTALAGNGTEKSEGVANGSSESAGTAEGTGNEPINVGLVEQMPEFPGGYAAFAKYLQRNLHYPHSASENGIMGRVFVNFIVEKDGSLTDISVSKGIGFGCDEEAVRVLKKSPKWSAGIQNKQKVRVMFTIPIVFSMGE